MHNKDLNLLRLLIILNEERQTVLAAKRMNLSQPTISIMLKKLRDQFDDPLFIRDKNNLVPTIKCLDILSTLPNLLTQLDKLYSDNTEWDISQLNGELHLLISPPLISTLGAQLIKKLTLLAPALTVQCSHWDINTPQRLEMNPHQHFGITYLPMETNKTLMEQEVGADEFAVVVHKDHPITEITIEEVLVYPIAICLIPGVTGPSKAEQLIRSFKLKKNINLRTSDIALMTTLMAKSKYIGIMPRSLEESIGKQFRFLSIPHSLVPKGYQRKIAFFCHQTNRKQPLTEWLLNETKLFFSLH
ncbi:LysR family transcriptional regulator [Aliivibrio sp. 1S165]|uniref:LysR family transcriptional regulator n=1 Tax=unclassified Aliivibrio TaxID=2645654 RepID=UPI00080E4DB6|nr:MULTISPECIES: LysR family transcriptional regulator [unclassified Aliivibrio]OCH15302.1 LysR family transcriptional regulator [Aliivibrio sp. 1S165]OCH34307.1 LysR family transcriptional regulator [Aliivibrio sp. 1S175]